VNGARPGPRRESGISYIEILIATVLILITLLPMMDAMRGATMSTAAHEEFAIRNAHLRAKMEEVLGEPFARLEAAASAAEQGGRSFDQPSLYTDAPGATDRRVVYLSYFDGDNADNDGDPFTGVDPGLMWVRTEIEGTRLAVESLVYR